MTHALGRAFILAVCMTFVLGTTVAAPPAEARSVTYDLNIPSQDLDAALQQLALASKHKLLYRSDLVAGKRSAALKRLIGFDPDAWEKVLKLKGDLYDPLSHAAALSLAYEAMLSTENTSILGSEYDQEKTDAYAKELQRCATSAESLQQLIVVVGSALVKAKRA